MILITADSARESTWARWKEFLRHPQALYAVCFRTLRRKMVVYVGQDNVIAS
jgi:hypothetical protein